MRRWIFLFLMIFLIAGIYAECDGTQIDINTADAKELEKLDGVGEARAEYIIDARPFDSLDELIEISGIGEKTLEKIKEQGLACVGDEDDEDKQEEVEIEEEQNSNETKEDKNEQNFTETINRDVLTLKTIELNTNSKDIKSTDNKEDLKKNLAFAGIVTFCVVFGGALFLSNIRKRKNEFR